MGKNMCYTDNQHKGQRGFSLIELAIVIIISGTLFAMAVAAYKQYFEKQQIYSTQAKIETVTEALDRFLSEYGHYPCPASFSAVPGDANFGTITDCYDVATVASGTCGDENGDGVDDYCVTEVTKDHDENPATPDITLRIRKGSIPFQALKEGIGWEVDEPDKPSPFTGAAPYGIRPGSLILKYQRTVDIGAGDSVDSYKNRLTYVLTEAQGTEDFLPRLGAIEIVDEHHTGADPRYLSKNADYVLISHGEDGGGAYGFYGDAQAGGCPASMPRNEYENCDGDEIYVSSLRYDAVGTEKYDDLLVYRTWVNYYLWDLSETDAKNIYNLNTGNVGIGVKDPEEKIHVFQGNVLADEVAEIVDSGPGPTTGDVIKPAGAVLASEYCGYDATGAVTGGVDCFLPEKIGGTGMDCDVDADILGGSPGVGPKIMRGIQEQQLKCAKLFDKEQNTACLPGTFAQGFEYDLSKKKITITSCRAP